MRSKTVAARLFLASSSCALATASLASETTTYTYDALGRLVVTSSVFSRQTRSATGTRTTYMLMEETIRLRAEIRAG
jgi:hypothetical protein